MNTLYLLGATTFFIFIFFRKASTLSEPPYVPTDEILINCGSSNTHTTSLDARLWIGDMNLTSGSYSYELSGSKSVAVSFPSDRLFDSVPYVFTSARLSRSPFTYSFTVSPGPKFIRLYFCSDNFLYGSSGGFSDSKDAFNVKAGHYVLLRNFSTASILADAFYKEFGVNVESHQKLHVTFTPFSDDSYAFVNGIEILSMPETLYHSPPNGLGVPFLGLDRLFKIQSITSFETVRRLNVGGDTIKPSNDTGMYRQWNRDDIYINSREDFITDPSPNITLNYSRIPKYTAPDDLYLSALGSHSATDNLTWVVSVDAGFNHLVRLHFCEFDPDINYGRSVIYLDNQMAEAGFDVFEASGGSNIPIYKDYVMAAGREGQTGDYVLFITLHLHPDSSSVHADAILNGLEVFKLSDSDGSLASGLINKPSTKKTLYLLLSVTVPGFFLTLYLVYCIVLWLLRRKSFRQAAAASSTLPHELCRPFSIVDIKASTKDFHKDLIIGIGGFGTVFRGEINQMVVAIKRFNPEPRSSQGAKEFKTEIEMLSQLRHINLVHLIGYSNGKGEMILVYDYMSNGTLKDHLYGTDNDPISWRKRLEISVGAARGLHYLHEEAAHKIIHRDVKTTNILLDQDWVAKIADFGLCKMFLNDKTVTTLVKGTWGYLDPEYARGHPLTEKSDVYSFGVVLLEVLCARKAVNMRLEDDQRSLASWAQKCIRNGTLPQIIDPYLKGRIAPMCFNKFVEVAESCLRDHGNNRPSMSEVMEELNFALELQVAADAEMERKGAIVSDCIYPEVSSFRIPSIYSNEDFSGGDGGLDLDSSHASTSLDKISTGINSSVVDSGSNKSGSIFSGTS